MESEELIKDNDLIVFARACLKYAIIGGYPEQSVIIHRVDNAIAKEIYDRYVEELERCILHGSDDKFKPLIELEASMVQTEPRKLTSKELRKRLKHARNYMEKKALEKPMCSLTGRSRPRRLMLGYRRILLVQKECPGGAGNVRSIAVRKMLNSLRGR